MAQSLLQKYDRLDQRIFFAAFIIIVIICLFFPLKLPLVGVDEGVSKMYDFIEALPEGTKVVLDNGVMPGAWPVVGPLWRQVFKQCLLNNLKCVIIGFYTHSTGITMGMFTLLDPFFKANNKVYGVDYVYMGYVAGIETGLVAWAADIRTTTPVDYKGNAIDSLPIMDGLTSLSDFKMCIMAEGGSSRWDPMMRQWAGVYYTAPYNVPFYALGLTSQRDTYYSYVRSNIVRGFFATNEGAWYEIKMNEVSQPAVSLLDGANVVLYVLFILVILGNVMFLAQKYGGKKKQ